MVQCEICLAEYQEGELELHLENCVLHLVFRCTHCNADYMNKEGLWNHMDQHDIPDRIKEVHCQEIKVTHKLHQCSLCNDQRAYAEIPYQEHVHDVHGGFKLSNADKSNTGLPVSSESDVHGNVRKHTEAKYQCPHCSKDFFEQNALRLHSVVCAGSKLSCELYKSKLNTKHDNVEGSSKKVTQESETGSVSLKVKKKEIRKVKTAMCPHCGKLLSASHLIPRHIEIWHVASSCDICRISFPNNYQKDSHVKSAHTQPKHKCPYCPLEFNNTSLYCSHLPLCISRKFTCDICGCKFKHNFTLVRHKRKSHPFVKVIENYASVENGNKQVATTEKEKKVVSNRIAITDCPICGETFGDQQLVDQHIQTIHRMTIRVFTADEVLDQEPTTAQNDSQFDVENSANELLRGLAVQTDVGDVQHGENLELKMEVHIEDTMVQETQDRVQSFTTTSTCHQVDSRSDLKKRKLDGAPLGNEIKAEHFKNKRPRNRKCRNISKYSE